MKLKDITFEPSVSQTQAQNRAVEQIGDIIIKKARVMWILANLPYNLWKKIINAATYLYNQTSREIQNWKSSYEVFFLII